MTGEPQLWKIEATGDAVTGLTLVDATGTSTQAAGDDGSVFVMYDAYLLPGDHVLRIDGQDGDYAITLTPLGPPDPEFEHEPNDTVDRSQPIRLLEPRSGRLATAVDADVYRFSLRNETYLEVSLDIPDDATYRASLNAGGTRLVDITTDTPGTDIAWRGMIPAGDYSLWLTPSTPSLEPYSLTLTPLDPFDTPDDLEPNDSEAFAAPMPASMQVSGVLDGTSYYGESDWYSIPPLEADTQLVLEFTPTVQASIMATTIPGSPAQVLPSVAGTVAGGLLVDVPGNVPLYLSVSGAGPYDIAIYPVSDVQPFVATPIAATDQVITAELDFGSDVPAAYWTTGQVVNGTLTLTNDGSSDARLDLTSRIGQADWVVIFDDDSIEVPGGATVTVPVAVHVAPDSWADQPIYVAIAASDGTNQASAIDTITPSRSAPPLNAEAWNPLPDSMLGGLDVAWSGLGAKPVALDDAAATVEAPLYDQMLTTGAGVRIDAATLPAEFTVDLAGDEDIPVAGIIIFPLGIDAALDSQIRVFELQVSDDGQAFTTVLTEELSTQGVEQAFALDSPVTARFARLRVLSAQSPIASTVSIGEWKVVAAPNWQPADTPFNLADPELGGHVVYQEPPLNDSSQLQLLLTPDGTRQTLDAPPDAGVTWVIGFHNDRAARIDGLQWVDPPGSDPETHLDTVDIAVSTESPLGPWTPVGSFPIERDGNGAATIAFDDAVWARFVRITATGEATPDPGYETVTWELPEQFLITEQPIGGDYTSILGEWGTYQSSAIYERSVNPKPVSLDNDAGNDAASASVLPMQTTHTDSAAVESDEDWYRVEVPPGDGVLTVSLSGIPALGVTASLFDDQDTEIAMEASATSATSLDLTASVEPGTYLMRVTQPPTSVVFAFDTSLSIGALEPAVYQGLARFASDVLPGRESVNILPFGEQLLLDTWSDDPYFLQSTIANYPRTSMSSDAEGAIVTANEALATRSGNRAIILITDAENSPTVDSMTKLWPGLATAAPRIFAVNIAGSEYPPHGQDLMQDWSMVNSGQYVYVRDQGEMDIAFDRAATELRRPSIYTIIALPNGRTPADPQPTATPTLPTPEPATPTPEPTRHPGRRWIDPPGACARRRGRAASRRCRLPERATSRSSSTPPAACCRDSTAAPGPTSPGRP